MFPFVLLLLIGGDPLPWAGFQSLEACKQALSHMALPKGVTGHCGKVVEASTGGQTDGDVRV